MIAVVQVGVVDFRALCDVGEGDGVARPDGALTVVQGARHQVTVGAPLFLHKHLRTSFSTGACMAACSSYREARTLKRSWAWMDHALDIGAKHLGQSGLCTSLKFRLVGHAKQAEEADGHLATREEKEE